MYYIIEREIDSEAIPVSILPYIHLRAPPPKKKYFLFGRNHMRILRLLNHTT